jgi:hypothetical protein
MSGNIINPAKFGVTFSIKQCRNFQLNSNETLRWLIKDAGFRRFRLMSYWNEHEKECGKYNFKELDWQIALVEKAGGEVTLSLGARQPRWPENHWPDWAWQTNKPERDVALLTYIETVVKRYRDKKCIVSYQLENEALLANFGEKSEIDRDRLKREFALVRALDPDRPIIMSTSTSWGIPIRQPIPDTVGFSYYHTLYRQGDYHTSTFFPWIHRLRKSLIYLLHRKPVFIHELQLEPWGPTAIWKMPIEEQAKSMDRAAIQRNISLARRIKATPIDLWGGEWWYWRLKNHNDPSIWQAVSRVIEQY